MSLQSDGALREERREAETPLSDRAVLQQLFATGAYLEQDPPLKIDKLVTRRASNNAYLSLFPPSYHCSSRLEPTGPWQDFGLISELRAVRLLGFYPFRRGRNQGQRVWRSAL